MCRLVGTSLSLGSEALLKDPKDVWDAGLAGGLGAASSGSPKDMHDALARIQAEARASKPDNAGFRAQMGGIAAQHAALMARQRDS